MVTTTVQRDAYKPVEAAARLSLSRSRVYELIANGELASFTVGRSRLVPAVAIDTFITERLAASRRRRMRGGSR
jgi:excisionase family DNA binding protein